MKLGPITALMIACFLGHFFIFQGLAVGETYKYKDQKYPCGDYANGDFVPGKEYDGIYNGCNSFGPGGETWEALYNLFGLLTTVNHPDVVMWLVDRKWYTFIMILSYM